MHGEMHAEPEGGARLSTIDASVELCMCCSPGVLYPVLYSTSWECVGGVCPPLDRDPPAPQPACGNHVTLSSFFALQFAALDSSYSTG